MMMRLVPCPLRVPLSDGRPTDLRGCAYHQNKRTNFLKISPRSVTVLVNYQLLSVKTISKA